MADGTNTSNTLDATTWKLVQREVGAALIELRRGQGELLDIVIKLALESDDGRNRKLLLELQEVIAHMQGPAVALDHFVDCKSVEQFVDETSDG